MRYTLGEVPETLERALRRRAVREGRTIEQVILDILMESFGLAGATIRRDLTDVVGTWHEDPAIDGALRDQRRIDSDLWR